MWLLQGGGGGLLLLGTLTVAQGGVQAHLQVLLQLLVVVVVVLLLGVGALGHPLHRTWGGFPLCRIHLESLAASHVLAECLSSMKDSGHIQSWSHNACT